MAPTSICDLSRRRPQSNRVGALGSPARRVRAEPGRREAVPPRLDSASQVSVRRPLCRLHLGKLWFAVWAAGRRAKRARPGAPRPLCTASRASRPWEPHQPRAPRPAPIEGPRVPGACPETQPCHRGLCGGSSLDPAGMRFRLLSPRRAGNRRGRPWPRDVWENAGRRPARAARVRPQERAGRRGALGASPQVPGAPGLWGVQAGRGGRAGGCGAVCSHWLHKREPHRGGQLALGASRARTALAPKPWNSLPESGGPEVHLPRDGGHGFSPRACHFLREGSVLREGSLGTQPQRLCAEPPFEDGLPA